MRRLTQENKAILLTHLRRRTMHITRRRPVLIRASLDRIPIVAPRVQTQPVGQAKVRLAAAQADGVVRVAGYERGGCVAVGLVACCRRGAG
jgi:hypothetical protein